MPYNNHKPVHILLVEDNEGDILLTTEALEEAKVQNTFSITRDGEKAIRYIERKGEFSESIVPDIIFLDVNLPKINGHEVLKFIKSHDQYKHIPVIMLTTSSSEKDVQESYRNHANCYITKPVEVEKFLSAVISIENFWIKLAKLPHYNIKRDQR